MTTSRLLLSKFSKPKNCSRGVEERSRLVRVGVVFGNFHFPGEQNANNLTIGALDPIAKISEFKVCGECGRLLRKKSSQ